jgi:hypothetical protein
MRNTLRPVWRFVLPYIGYALEGVPAYSYIVWEDRVTWNPGLILAYESYLSTTLVVFFCTDWSDSHPSILQHI